VVCLVLWREMDGWIGEVTYGRQLDSRRSCLRVPVCRQMPGSGLLRARSKLRNASSDGQGDLCGSWRIELEVGITC